MSIEATSWALRKAPVGSDCTARLILTLLADYARADGRGAYPSVGTLSQITGVSVSTIHRKLRILESQGVIVKGDQALVEHFRADRRPTVWDLNMGLGPEFTSEGPVTPEPDNSDSTGCQFDTPCESVENTSVSEGDGVVHSGVSRVTGRGSRGVTGARHGVSQVTHNPSFNPLNPPIVPPAGAGGTSEPDFLREGVVASVSSIARQADIEVRKPRPREVKALGEICEKHPVEHVLEVARFAWSDPFWKARLFSLGAFVRNFAMVDAQCQQAMTAQRGSVSVPEDPSRPVKVTSAKRRQVPIFSFGKLALDPLTGQGGLELSRAHLDGEVPVESCPVCRVDERNRSTHAPSSDLARREEA